jgi:hypothetical protein
MDCFVLWGGIMVVLATICFLLDKLFVWWVRRSDD